MNFIRVISDKDVNDSPSPIINNFSFSLMNKLEIDVAELLVKHIPSARNGEIWKNGGDATTIAIFFAKFYFFLKQKLAFCGYHGWHDWFFYG